MNPIRLVIVIPCFSLDDFPDNLDEPMASDFLNAWSALWHPSVLHCCRSLPEWKRSDSSSLDLDRAVILVPQASMSRVDSPLRERITLANALVDSQGESRESLAKIVLEAATLLDQEAEQPAIAGSPDQDAERSKVDQSPSPSGLLEDENVLDFYALGFAYLQIQMLTRKIRYSSNLNQPLFEEQLQKATEAAMARDEATCQQWLQSCFDQLSQEREHYYSQSAYLLDVCLLAETTLGSRLNAAMEVDHPLHILSDAGLLHRLQQANATAFEHLLSKQQAGGLCLLGGLSHASRPLRWMSPQGVDREIEMGKLAYREMGLQAPTVFASFQPVMNADLGSVLKRHDYEGSLVIDWLNDAYPKGTQNKITWEAADGSGLDAIANGVLDANSSSQLLTIGARLATQFDYHQTPTLILAHWPMRSCQAFADLVRVSKRTPALGIWCNANEYFATTQRPYHQQRLAPEKFLPPIVVDDYAKIPSLHTYWNRSSELAAAQQTTILAEQVRGYLQPKLKIAADQNPSTESTQQEGESLQRLQKSLNRWIEELQSEDEVGVQAADLADRKAFDEYRQNAHRMLQAVLPRNNLPSAATTGNAQHSWLLINSFLGPRRVFLEGLPGSFHEDREHRLYAAETDGTVSDVVIDIPPCGFVRVSPSNASRSGRAKPIANAAGVLGNEFLECHIDPKTGRLSGLYIANRRGNRLSGMLALRLKGNDAKSVLYSESQVTRFQIAKNHSVCGRYAIEGTFRHERQEIGTFAMTYTLWRGSRLLEIEFQRLEINASWKERVQYAAWRTAWPNESAILHTWPQGIRQTVAQRRFYSPVLVEIDEAEHRSHLVTAGLPFHQKVDSRFLDTLLSDQIYGLSDQRYGLSDHGSGHARLGLGIDLPRPYQNALEWMVPVPPLPDPFPPISSGSFAWFFQCASPHVQIDLLRNVQDETGRCTGIWLMLSETNNQATSIRLECFRSPKQVDRISASGVSLGTVEVHDDTLKLAMRANEQVLLHVQWN